MDRHDRAGLLRRARIAEARRKRRLRAWYLTLCASFGAGMVLAVQGDHLSWRLLVVAGMMLGVTFGSLVTLWLVADG